MKKITKESIEFFRTHLINEEKSSATIEKYIRDVTVFMGWAENRVLEKSVVLDYKHSLIEKYAPSSVNSVISSLNSFFSYNKWYDMRVKSVKIQKQMFTSKELTKEEYKRLLNTAMEEKDDSLYYLMQTICSCGLRVSELKFITTDAVKSG